MANKTIAVHLPQDSGNTSLTLRLRAGGTIINTPDTLTETASTGYFTCTVTEANSAGWHSVDILSGATVRYAGGWVYLPGDVEGTYVVDSPESIGGGGGGLDAAGVRAAIGLASANLDTQLADLPTVSELNARTLVAADYFVVGDYTAPANSDITAIKAKTDNLPSSPASSTDVQTLAVPVISPTLERINGDTDAIRFTWPVNSATITGEVSKNGGSYAAVAGAITQRTTEAGVYWYQLAHNAADRTLGSNRYKFTDGTRTRFVNLLVNPATASVDLQPVLDKLPESGRATTAPQVRTELSTELARIDTTISSRSTFAGGAVASVTDPVTVGTINANAITATSIANDALTSTKFATSLYNAIAAAVDAALLDAGDATDLIASIVTRIGSTNVDQTAFVAAVKAALFDAGSASNKLAVNASGEVVASNMRGTDNALLASSYTAPANSDITAIKTKTDQFVFTVANQVDANALTGGGGLDASGIRAAVGLASANLDTQLGDIPTNAEFEARSIASADYFVVSDYTAPPTASAIADAVLTESVMDHRNVAHSLAKFVWQIRQANLTVDGTVSNAITPTTLTFASNVAATTSAYAHAVLLFITGPLTGENSPIISYNNTNGVFVLEEPLTAAPTSGDEFVVIAGSHVHSVANIQSGLATTTNVTNARTAIIEDTENIQSRLPAALDSGRIIAKSEVVTGTVTLATSQPNYAPSKAGDAMTLTGGERIAVANEVEAQIIDDTDSEKVLQAIVDKIAAANPSLDDLTLGAIASAVRTELATELARIDAAITTRATQTSVDTVNNFVDTEINTLLNRVPGTIRTASEDVIAETTQTTAIRNGLSTEIYEYFASGTRPDVFKADVSALATSSSQDDILEILDNTVNADDYLIPITIKNSTGNVIPYCKVTLTTSNSGSSIGIKDSQYCNQYGKVEFRLDPGTYYIWREKIGFAFNDPFTLVINSNGEVV
jgi:hypothetical protein